MNQKQHGLSSKNKSADLLLQAENPSLQDVKEMMEPELDLVLNKAIKEIDQKIQTDKATLITIFGIFASITSFLTIEFQFLKTLSNLEQIIGFSCILFALLFGFNIALDYLVKSRIDKEIPKLPIFYNVFILILFGIGVFFIFISNKKTFQENQNYQKNLEILENKFTDFQTRHELIIKEFALEFNKLNNKINSQQ